MKPRTMLLILCLLAISLACNLQINWTTEGQPQPSVAPLFPSAPAVGSPAQSTATRAIPTVTLRPTTTFRPTLTRTLRVVYTPSMTGTPTNTALPPLPDFPDVLTFGGGGGAVDCGMVGFPPGPEGVSLMDVQPGRHAIFCTTIWRPRGGVIRLELISPAGLILDSPNLVYNPSTQNVEWSGYPGFVSAAQRTSDSTQYANVIVWWPIIWPAGQWRVHVYGGQSIADQTFWVAKKGGRPYIVALDARAEVSLMPSGEGPAPHPVRPNPDGTVDVVGTDLPPASRIFILLYRVASRTTLFEKMAATTDGYGSLRAQLSGPFSVGSQYLLIGLSDPNTPLSGEVLNSTLAYPTDLFQVMR